MHDMRLCVFHVLLLGLRCQIVKPNFKDSTFSSFDDGVIVGMLQSGHLFLWSPNKPQTLGLVYGLTQFLADGETSSKTSKSRVVTPWNNVCNSGNSIANIQLEPQRLKITSTSKKLF